MVSDLLSLRDLLPTSCLNPCCNGRWALTPKPARCSWWQCLNPCCNGIWSLTMWTSCITRQKSCLNPCFNGWRFRSPSRFTPSYRCSTRGLNPCCDGMWSLTPSRRRDCSMHAGVLILVVMEDGLWQPKSHKQAQLEKWCLNPCCNGRWSLSRFYL